MSSPPAPVAVEKPKTVKPRKEGGEDKKSAQGGRGQGRGQGREGGRGGRGEGRGRGERKEGAARERGPRPERTARVDRPEGSTGTNLRPERERGERPDRSHVHNGDRKRTYERRSGTGRGKEVSKSGSGGHNWGNENEKSELVVEAEIQEGNLGEAADDDVAKEEVDAEVQPDVEEEDNTMTLEEFMAKKSASRGSSELFGEIEVRKITNEFADAALVTKNGKTPDFIESSYEKVFTKKTSGRKKQLLTDVGFNVVPAQPTREPRGEFSREGGGGRLGGRSGGGRFGGDGQRHAGRGQGRGRGFGGDKRGSHAKAPNVADTKAFPSL